MTHLLPPPLLRLFAPRPPLEYARPLPGDKDPNARPSPRTEAQIAQGKIHPLEGVAAFLERVRQDLSRHATDEDNEACTYAAVTQTEMRREERTKARAQTQQRMLENYHPKQDTHAAGDPFKTLFVARLPYSTTESDLAQEFERYGPIQNIRLVRDGQGRSRGYAFLLFERERDMRTAYSRAEGLRLDGRRVLVDVERGRTVRDWKPMRLGGGLGGQSRKPKQKVIADAYRGARGDRGGRMGGGRGGFRGGRGGGGGGFRGGFRDRERDRDHGYPPRDRRRPRDAGYRDRDGLSDYGAPGSGGLSYGGPSTYGRPDERSAKRLRY
ncbi:hypothetical protein MNAN1_000565 [Malassezia nana]|uniref:RRM domain-containing protein n=1 Tax=Malassezia nana TaxID=180528 RepID=A0AAF0EFR5_9BASI|nr:hypothetical protein MNAN1_000565 [Malassezia nana]